ncbi:hypothetical protein CHUAL_004276 [Chamberlinius hualienensis]
MPLMEIDSLCKPFPDTDHSSYSGCTLTVRQLEPPSPLGPLGAKSFSLGTQFVMLNPQPLWFPHPQSAVPSMGIGSCFNSGAASMPSVNMQAGSLATATAS